MDANSQCLAGKQIVITRPAHQAQMIQDDLLAQQATVTLFPVLEIMAIDSVNHHADNKVFDWLIFISPNAVKYAQTLLADMDLSTTTVAAIGKKTAQQLQHYGITAQLVPETGFNTESFLQLSATHAVKGTRILIIRGQGGRELLADTLRQRGAWVQYAEVYQRICPTNNTEQLKQQWQQQLLDIIVITSSEGLNNLYKMTTGSWIKQVPLLLGSVRMQHAAIKLGHQGKIIMASNPSDEAVLQRLKDWAQQELIG